MTNPITSNFKVRIMKEYLQLNNLFVNQSDPAVKTPAFSELLHLHLDTIVPCVAGPKRPQDKVALSDVKSDFQMCLAAPVSFKGYNVPSVDNTACILYQNKNYELKHGSIVIASITSCTNTSNPTVLLGAALLAKKAYEKGLRVKPYIKTSLSPGSKAVTEYLHQSGLMPYLEKLGFYHAGYGCMTCIGNSGELDREVADAIIDKDLVVTAVLSGNRNFEGRVHPLTRANYLASPPLVVAFALAGRIDHDFEKDPIGVDLSQNPIYLRDIWPLSGEIAVLEEAHVKGSMFSEVYKNIKQGNPLWNALPEFSSIQFPWDNNSSYIHNPPFFQTMGVGLPQIADIENAHCLLYLGDSITTDHISPAGNIAKSSPASLYLEQRGISRKDFNTYGSRRGNDEVMTRGTFANIRLINKMCPEAGPKTIHIPSGELMMVFDATERYKAENIPTIVIAGKEYGSGSSRDWAAKGPFLLGVKAIIAESFERIHRTNLVGMGILPLQFLEGESATTFNITGKETFSIPLHEGKLSPGQMLEVRVAPDCFFSVKCRIDTEAEVQYFRNGGILQFVLRSMLQNNLK